MPRHEAPKYGISSFSCQFCQGDNSRDAITGRCGIATIIERHVPCSGGQPFGCGVYQIFKDSNLRSLEPKKIKIALGIKL